MMRKNHKKKNNMFLILFLMILGIGLGYALLSQDLAINGITKVKGNTWDIHFDNIQISEESVTLSEGDAPASIDSEDDTLVEYTVTLNLPGDYYEFTVDAVNEGTVDGMIGEIITKLNGVAISSENPLPDYLDYTFSYSDGVEVSPNHLLAAGNSETYKVRVEFKRDIENSELPTTDQTNTFSFGVSYVQSDDNAIAVPHTVISTVYTANIYDEDDEENTVIWIGSAIPNAITQYTSASEARAALTLANEGTPVQFCLKHATPEGLVTESYIEFIVTSEMATANSGMTAGTYAIRGFDTYDEVNDECEAEYYDSTNDTCLSPYYSSNITILQTAFGIDNCSGDEYAYGCSVPGLVVDAYSFGTVYAYVGRVGCYCFIHYDGYSRCNDW